MKRALPALAGLILASQAVAQAPSPAQLGITPTTNPEALQVLDSTKTWVPLGGVDPVSHTFTPVGGGGGGGGGGGTGEVDIVVTDPTIGMVAGGADNSPHVSALMAKMGPAYSAAALTGYDVTFPSIPGQQYTTYYFTNSLVLSRGARYHCSGAAGATSGGYAQTILAFAPGVDGVVQEDHHYTSDGGIGAGSFDNCGIYSMGYGVAVSSGLTTGSPPANTQLTGAFNYGIGNTVNAYAPAAGDGIIVTPFFGRYYPWFAVPAVAPGAYIASSVNDGTGHYTITLASGYTLNYGFGAAFASFKQTGQSNPANGDTLTAGNVTLNFVTTIGSTPGNVLIGSDWYITMGRAAAAIDGTNGFLGTWACTNTANYICPSTPPNVVAIAPISAFMAFWAKFAGTAGNSLAVAYTGTAGAWQAPSTTTFVSGYDQNNVAYYQLPASKKFMVQTTAGSNTATVISGPRPMQQGDVVWSDAFPFGTTVIASSPMTSFPQTITMTSPFMNGVAVNAAITHAPGAEGQLWTMPSGLKRDVTASASYNAFEQWPIGMKMACSDAAPDLICTVSHDFNNTGYLNLFGRWVSGNNTGGSSSINDSFGKNFIADVMEGGAVGSAYFDLHSESPENGEGPYNVLGNCVSQNTSNVTGGYAGGTGQPDCAQQVGLFPPTAGGFLRIGPNNTTPVGAPVIAGARLLGQWINLSGMNNQDCVSFGRGPGGGSPYGGGYTLGVSNSACGTSSTTLSLNFNTAVNAWDWGFSSNPMIRYVDTFLGYTGYSGPGLTMAFPAGAIMAGDGNTNVNTNARLFAMTNVKPTGNWHLRGDTEINTVQSPGGQMAWYYAPAFSTTLTAAVVKGTTTSVTVTACPPVAPPAGTLISDVSISLSPNVNLGVFSTCSAGTLTFTAAALNNSFAATDAIQFLYPYPAGAISNDPNNPDYTATTIRSGSSSNKDITGRITLAGGTATYTLAGVYATAPVCLTADATTPANASSVSESTTVLTFTGTGTDVIKYECVGRN